MEKQVKVSILCNTYNQREYINRAIRSFLYQDTTFKYEIVIHDDASTDGTKTILEKYEKAYPNFIKVVYEKENKYSRGISFMFDMVKNYICGDYIALCEGDDYWIDENKLQIQYEALEKHKESDMCACWGCTVTEDGSREISDIRPMKEDGILSVEDVILGGGQYLVTAGLFARRNIYFDMMEMGYLDYAQQLRGALRGGIIYIDRKMAVYRRYSKGSWTNEVLKNNEKLKIQWDKEIQLLDKFDKSTDGKYHDIIAQRKKSYCLFTEQLEDNKEEIAFVLKKCKFPCYIWGLGRRGTSLEEYLRKIGFCVDGVCDAIDENIGMKTEFDNVIYSTNYVLESASTIIASTRWAYDDLIKLDFNGDVMDFQTYMPYG